jgi:pimeloyl-ACP methyl ester carboxylesterase
MSQGGFVSLRVALRAPDRVRALILLDTQAGAEDPEVIPGYEAMTETWLTAGPVDELVETISGLIISDPEVGPIWIAKWKQRPNDSILQPFATLISREDITDRLGEIACPALVVHGTDDVAISMEKAERLAAGLPGSGPVVKVSGAHAANLTNPEPVNAAIVGFLAGLGD